MDQDEFPANSRVNRPAEKPDEKKVERVVLSGVSRRKPPLGRRFKELFVRGDAQSVGGYILNDILLPAVKDTIADMVSQGIERMLFGEGRSTSRRTGARPGAGPTPYHRYASTPPWQKDRQREEPRSRQARGTHNFDDIILETRVEGEEVVERLYDLVNRYQEATVADLYELVGLPAAFTDEKWGWTELRGAGVTRISNGYLLDLPRPIPLD